MTHAPSDRNDTEECQIRVQLIDSTALCKRRIVDMILTVLVMPLETIANIEDSRSTGYWRQTDLGMNREDLQWLPGWLAKLLLFLFLSTPKASLASPLNDPWDLENTTAKKQKMEHMGRYRFRAESLTRVEMIVPGVLSVRQVP